jgi:hypothetical protein
VYGVFGPFFAGADVRWITQPQGPQRGAATLSSAAGGEMALPPFTSGAALDGGEVIAARATDTGPVQVVAVPAIDP